MDQPKIERVLRLMELLTANVRYNVDELAQKLDINKRSVYRYLDTFKEAGFVVRKDGDIYSLSKESPYFKDITQLIHFTDEEAYIFNKLLDALDDTNELKQNLRRKLASVYHCTSIADCVVRGRNAKNVNALVEAIENQRQVVLRSYASSHGGDIRDHRVEPFAFTANYVQIWCYDLEDGMNKLFRTARIGSVEDIGEWTEEHKHKQGYMDIFRMSGENVYTVRLEMGLMARNLLLEEYPLAESCLFKINGNRWLLKTDVCSLKGVARFAIGMADDVRVIGSPELIAYIDNFVHTHLARVS